MWSCSPSPCCNESRQKREEVIADSGTAVQQATSSERGEANIAFAGLVSASAVQLEAEKGRTSSRSHHSVPSAVQLEAEKTRPLEAEKSTRFKYSVLSYPGHLEDSSALLELPEDRTITSADASACSEPLPEPSSRESFLQEGNSNDGLLQHPKTLAAREDGHSTASSAPPHPHFISLRISCNPQSRLGITVDLCDNKLCFVKHVKSEGLVPDWNAVCKPGQDVRQFDRLIAVNGICGTTNDMVKNIMMSIRKTDTLAIVFMRCICFEASIVKNHGTVAGPGLASHMTKPEYLAPTELDPKGALQAWNNRVEASHQISKSSRIIAVNGQALDGSMILKFMASMKEFCLTIINWPSIDDRESIVRSMQSTQPLQRMGTAASALPIQTNLWEEHLWKLDMYRVPMDWDGTIHTEILSDWANWRYQSFTIEPDDIASARDSSIGRTPTMESRLCISYVNKKNSKQSTRSLINKSMPVRLVVLPQIKMSGKDTEEEEEEVLERARRYKTAHGSTQDLSDIPNGKLPPNLHAVFLSWTDGSNERLVVASPQLQLMVGFCHEIQSHTMLNDDAIYALSKKTTPTRSEHKDH